MSIEQINEITLETHKNMCQCGRSLLKIHCPFCGRANFYALKDKIKRPHPQTGIITETNVFRCRGCNSNFDELQWRFDCKAPPSITKEYKQRKEMTAEMWRQKALSGIKFDTNMERAFRKAVGVSHEDFMQLWRRADDLRIKGQFQKLGLSGTATPKLVSPEPKIVIEQKQLTPYQVHTESCSKFTLDEQCDVCDNLRAIELAEKEKK